MEPFASKYRPKSLDEVIGQTHLIGKNKIINRLLENKYLPNMIFYGPPGVGKTTIAKIIAKEVGFKYVELNATNCGTKEIKEILDVEDVKECILFIDEFHALNKKQQQVLLDSTETGSTILIASTTENPYFAIYKAILSRCNIFEFKPLNDNDIEKGLETIIPKIKEDYPTKEIEIEDGLLQLIAKMANGDYRSAINKLELLFYKNLSAFSNIISLTKQDFDELAISSSYNYDKDGDAHYDALSAFHKSLRGSDVDAAIYYLARLLKGGDLVAISRRLLCVASEDVGMANPNATQIVKSCVDSALQLGMPEARLPLANATIFLALQPKSNSCINAIDKALDLVDNGGIYDIPNHLKDAHYGGASKLGHGVEYKYPHNYPNHYIKQQYLPNEIKDEKFYDYGINNIEKSYENYWNTIKKDC
jgi:putative ATPase